MCWMSLLRSLGELLCTAFYKHYAPLALRNQRVCQRYRLGYRWQTRGQIYWILAPVGAACL